MHREIYNLCGYASGDVVIVELSLNGTHRGPLELPVGTIPPTGKEIHAPCCDVFHLVNGKSDIFSLLHRGDDPAWPAWCAWESGRVVQQVEVV